MFICSISIFHFCSIFCKVVGKFKSIIGVDNSGDSGLPPAGAAGVVEKSKFPFVPEVSLQIVIF